MYEPDEHDQEADGSGWGDLAVVATTWAAGIGLVIALDWLLPHVPHVLSTRNELLLFIAIVAVWMWKQRDPAE